MGSKKKFVISKVTLCNVIDGELFPYVTIGDKLWVSDSTHDGYYDLYYVNGVSIKKILNINFIPSISKNQVDER